MKAYFVLDDFSAGKTASAQLPYNIFFCILRDFFEKILVTEHYLVYNQQ